MAVMVSATNAVTKRLPKVLKPKAHAAADYFVAGAFLAGSVLFWRTHRSAALGAAACGGLKLLASALTDFDGDGDNPISLPLHRKAADYGIAALSAAVPELLDFKEAGPKRFFLVQAIAITAITNMTDFEARRESLLGLRFRKSA
jgi:hypothetical protein